MHRNKLAILASTALCLSFATQNANAADLIKKAPAAAPIAMPAADPWTGLYVGINGGYSWGRARSSASVEPFFLGAISFDFPGASSGNESLNLNGGVFGGQIGYTFKFAPSWYAGLEADFQWTGQKDSARLSFSGAVSPCTTQVCDFTNSTDITAKLSWFGTVRGLLGTDVNGMFLYVTGGWAYGRVSISGENRFFVTDNDTNDFTFSKSFSDAVNKSGYAAGLGVRGKLGKDVFWGIEYLHLDLGSVGTQKFSDPPVNFTVKTTRVTDEILRVSLSWRLTP